MFRTIGVIAGVDAEAAALFPGQSANVEALHGFMVRQVQFADRNIAITCSGIGKVNAAMAAMMLVEHYHADLFIVVVTAGKLTALAVGSPKRHPVSPAVATFEELGVKGVEVDLWYAFFAPAKTPAPVIARLNTEVVSILKLPEIRDLLGRAGMDAAASTTEELGALSVKDYPRWGEVIRRNGITAE